VLLADRGTWKSDSRPSFTYQWCSCQPDGRGCVDRPLATDQLYTPRAADVGRTLRVTVTATNKRGATAVTSGASAAVAALPAQAPHNTAPPTISGTVGPGQPLTASPGTWTGAAPISFSYRWRRCGPRGGACTDTNARAAGYSVSGADAGHALRVLVIARNAAGTSAALSAPSAPAPVAAKPAITSPPSIAGTPQEGRTLTGNRGSWTNSPTGYAFRWLRCDVHGGDCDKLGNEPAHTLRAADVGHTIRFAVKASNAAGTTTALSAPTAVVAPAGRPTPAPPRIGSPPTITGSPRAGTTLRGDRGSWANGPTDFDYQWLRCDRTGGDCDSIDGADGTTYLIRAADVGHTLRFRVVARNQAGRATATSAPTAVVTASTSPANTVPPTISGTAEVGAALTGNRGSWTHDPTAYGYAWLRCDRTGGSCAAIPGARGTSYMLTSGDVGTTLRFRVTATNSAGSTTAASVPTAVVRRPAAPPPPRPAGCPARASTSLPLGVAGIAAPARLLVDAVESRPRIATRATLALVVRFHVTSTCGGPVQGALVYATATPYNQFSIPPEVTTDRNGWATLVFRRLRGFPVSRRQQLIAMFVRARKPGESLLGGISTRRLVSIPVDLR